MVSPAAACVFTGPTLAMESHTSRPVDFALQPASVNCTCLLRISPSTIRTISRPSGRCVVYLVCRQAAHGGYSRRHHRPFALLYLTCVTRTPQPYKKPSCHGHTDTSPTQPDSQFKPAALTSHSIPSHLGVTTHTRMSDHHRQGCWPIAPSSPVALSVTRLTRASDWLGTRQ